jgi:hypothetical protein
VGVVLECKKITYQGTSISIVFLLSHHLQSLFQLKTKSHDKCIEGEHKEKEQEEQEVTDGNSPDAQPPQELPVRSAKRLASARISAGIACRRMNSRSQVIHKSPRKTDFPEVPSPSHAEDDNNQRHSSNSPVCHLPDFTFPEEFPDTPLLDEDTCDPASDSPSELLPDFPDLDLWYDYSIDFPLEEGKLDPIMSVDEHRFLTEKERIEFYNLIDQSISPPNGVEECSGTYSAYMKERSRFYFDRLFSKDSQGQSKLYHPNQEDRRLVISPGEASDFRKWVSSSASQHFVRAVAHFQTEDIQQPNHLRDHQQVSGSLQYPNLRSCTQNSSPVWTYETNENSFDDRVASPPSQRPNTPSMFMRSASHFNPALSVPAATVHHSSAKLMDNNGAKRSDVLRCKLVPLNHGSPGFVPHHLRPNRLRTVSAGGDF